jgi:acyl carrier protein
MTSMNATVRAVLAHQPSRDPSAIRPWHHLEHDLGMTPLELVLVVVKVEEIEGVELPVEDLSMLSTVGELVTFLTRAVLLSEQVRLAP